MGYTYAYEIEEMIDLGILPVLLSSLPSFLLSIAAYVLTALALQTVASRRGLNNPWLAWIPVASSWLLGSISDQYRYVARNQVKSKRKILLTLNILSLLCGLGMVILGVTTVVNVVTGAIQGVSEEAMVGSILGPVIGIMGVCVPMVGVAIANMIVRYMAMYDVYTSMDPGNSVMYLVLSIVFSITEPFFLFFNRHRDGGMPPRKQPAQPVYTDYAYREPAPEQPSWEQNGYQAPAEDSPEPWNRDTRDYQ